MSNKEYAEAMRAEADKWMQLMPVTKELWLQIADRIDLSPDPLEIRVAARKEKRKRPVLRRILEKLGKPRRPEQKAVQPFVWQDL